MICQDTNTDVIVCIKAVKTKNGAQYVYACGSFADWDAHAELDGDEIWMAPSDRKSSRGPTSVHWVRIVGREPMPPIAR